MLSIKEYLNTFKPYFRNIINDHKEECKIQLMTKINFFTAKEPIKVHEMYRTSKKIKILTDHEKDEIVEELFGSLLQKYHYALGKTQEGNNYVFDSIAALYYKLRKTSLHRQESYIDSPEWLKNKKATINSKKNKKDDKCFQYAIMVALT